MVEILSEKMKCLFCDKEFKKKDKKKGYGICITCKISILRDIKKPEYIVMIKDKDVKLVNGRLIKELKGQGYKVIK